MRPMPLRFAIKMSLYVLILMFVKPNQAGPEIDWTQRGKEGPTAPTSTHIAVDDSGQPEFSTEITVYDQVNHYSMAIIL